MSALAAERRLQAAIRAASSAGVSDAAIRAVLDDSGEAEFLSDNAPSEPDDGKPIDLELLTLAVARTVRTARRLRDACGGASGRLGLLVRDAHLVTKLTADGCSPADLQAVADRLATLSPPSGSPEAGTPDDEQVLPAEIVSRMLRTADQARRELAAGHIGALSLLLADADLLSRTFGSERSRDDIEELARQLAAGPY